MSGDLGFVVGKLADYCIMVIPNGYFLSKDDYLP